MVSAPIFGELGLEGLEAIVQDPSSVGIQIAEIHILESDIEHWGDMPTIVLFVPAVLATAHFTHSIRDQPSAVAQ